MANWLNRQQSGLNSSTTRKKWNLEDQKSLRNLKYHFAEDGCSEVQYALAKQLLQESPTSTSLTDQQQSGSNENNSQAVYWLLKAAQQGHEDALVMLNDCYQSGKGINESNEAEVHNCLRMTAGERAARRAAQELFASLSNGEEYVTAAQLERRMRDIYKLHKRKRKNKNHQENIEENENLNGNAAASPSSVRLQSASSTSYSTINHISEQNLLSAAINYSNGHLPVVSNALTLSIPDPESLNHIPYFHRAFFHPIIFFSLLYHKFIAFLSSFPGSTIQNFQILIALFIYTLISSDNLVMFFPIGGYYISLVVMILCTFRMLKSKHEFIDFRMWSGLFLRYGDENLNTHSENSENQFLRNNLKPYLYFFMAFFINLMLHPIISDQWLPHSEITVVSFILTFITMIAFMYTSSHSTFPDYLILFSFGLNVLAKYPYEFDSVVTTGWRFLDLKVPAFSTFVIGNGIEFCLNCRALLYLQIPGFLIYLAHRKNWSGTYQYLIPHCVTLSWLQICIISSQSATMFGLMRAALGLSGLLLFLPLFGIVTLLIPVFATIEWLSLSDSTIRLWSSILAAIGAIIISCFMALYRRTERYITFLQISICILATIFLTIPYMTSSFDEHQTHRHHVGVVETSDRESSKLGGDVVSESALTWDSYYKYCHQPAWESVNKIKTQLRCSHLHGTLVRWEGLVSDMEISNRQNFRDDFIQNYLPKFLASKVQCFFGESNDLECDSNENCDDEIKQLMRDNNRYGQCNLNKWNTYEYEIKVRMSSGLLTTPPEVVLSAKHIFGNFTQSLNVSDRIWFIGILRNYLPLTTAGNVGALNGDSNEKTFSKSSSQSSQRNNMRLGRKNPLIELQAIGCIHCHNSELTSVYATDGMKINARMRDLLRGIKYLLNVIFNPLFIFK
uniref:Putative glutamate-cysteine ligase regulatory-subunit n=1 Tax=Corethrella appendiculata TaxID=1370023 RepID=U5EYL1_9DIPT